MLGLCILFATLTKGQGNPYSTSLPSAVALQVAVSPPQQQDFQQKLVGPTPVTSDLLYQPYL